LPAREFFFWVTQVPWLKAPGAGNAMARENFVEALLTTLGEMPNLRGSR